MTEIRRKTMGKGLEDNWSDSYDSDLYRNRSGKFLAHGILIIWLCFSMIIGCAAIQGKTIKSYESEYHDTVRASSDTLKNLKIPVTEKNSDELKTVMNARRFDGTPVTIEVVRINRNLTEVSVRTGEGVKLDNRVSKQIHEFIGENLNRQASRRITEEELDDDSAGNLATVSTPDDQIPGQDPEKYAGVYKESVFVIYFGLDSNELSAKAKAKLDRVAEIIFKNPEVEITLNGYTDSYGEPSYNKVVSEMRANMVKTYLVEKGVDSSKIETIGHGPQKFLASNKTRAGRSLNRRVEIEFNNTAR